MDDIDRVLEVARRYDVAVFRLGARPLRELKKRLLTSTATEGPTGHFCDAHKCIVWFRDLEVESVRTHLHEIVHCIMQPPSRDIDAVPEDALLMPFERVLARQVFGRETYRDVIAWQEDTHIEWWTRRTKTYAHELGAVPNYTRRVLWRESIAALHLMGALANGKVTWQRPDWRRMPAAIRDRIELRDRRSYEP